jgi:hypothetical protein
LSVVLQHTRKKCNALQTLVGVFFHAAGTPETVIEAFTKMGVSISPSSIQRAVSSLSADSSHQLKALGRTLLVSLAYDNFDFKQKPTSANLEGTRDLIIHMTSGTLIPLQHGVTLEDLRCAPYLWEKSPWRSKLQGIDPLPIPFHRLYSLPCPVDSEADLSEHKLWQAWKFRHTLVMWGPDYFRRFSSNLGQPRILEGIPHFPAATQRPLRATDDPQSSTGGNISAIEKFMRQPASEKVKASKILVNK